MTLWWIAFAVFGLWSVAMVGVSGGPNHGEHPFLCSVFHALAFAFKGPALPTLANRGYWGALAVAGVLSIVAMRWMNAGEREVMARWQLLLRVGIALAYCAMLALLVLKPGLP